MEQKFRKSNGTRIDPDSTVELFNAYGIYARIVNHYHMKLKAEEDSLLYDWYYTTGSLVQNNNGYLKKVTTLTDPEDVITFILNHKRYE